MKSLFLVLGIILVLVQMEVYAQTLMVQKPDFGYKNPYEWYFDFCIDSIHYYNDKIRPFDYEEFYDYLKEKAEYDNG